MSITLIPAGLTTYNASIEIRQLPGAAPDEHAHVIQRVSCTHCGIDVELECAGLQGFWGYHTYNEFICPRCRKQNHARTPGAILSVRVPEDGT